MPRKTKAELLAEAAAISASDEKNRISVSIAEILHDLGIVEEAGHRKKSRAVRPAELEISEALRRELDAESITNAKLWEHGLAIGSRENPKLNLDAVYENAASVRPAWAAGR